MSNHIKIKNTRPKIQYIADGEATTYEFPFVIFKPENIKIYFNEIEQLSGFIVELNIEKNGIIKFTTPPAKNTIITIIRNIIIERKTGFQPGGAIRADDINLEFDYQLACSQQIAEELNRSIILPPYANDIGVDFTMPNPTPGKSIVWSADGKSFENSEIEVNKITRELNEKVKIATEQAEISTTNAVSATIAASNINGKAENDLINSTDSALANLISNSNNQSRTTLLNLLQPDWTTPITKPTNGFTADTYGVAVARRSGTIINQGLAMMINDIAIMGSFIGVQSTTIITISPLLYPGDVISFENHNPQTLKFYPLKEVI